MARDKTGRVFISYARKDASELAQRLCERLDEAGLEPWLDRSRIEGGAVWSAEIERAIDACEVIVALLSAGSYQSDICRGEIGRALRKGKRVIPVLAQPGADVPIQLEGAHHRRADEVDVLIEDIRGGEIGAEFARRYRRKEYVTVPPLPRNYVDRPEEIERLRRVLIMDEPGPSVAVTALKGMGGIGKTVLAQALAHDETVRDAFPDGIAWCTVGRESTSDFVDRMREVRRALRDEPGDKETQLECVNRYRTAMAQKAALVIVDDVWRTADIEPFVAESARSRLLFTTRDGSIAGAVGADEQRLDVLAGEKARELLAKWAGVEAGALPDAADEVIRECGGLPLAISMVGAMVRGKPGSYWGTVLGLLRRADLDKFPAPVGYAQRTLLRAIQVSVDALDERARERYLALAVLLEDMPAHAAIQRTLWAADEFECVETAEQFVSLSLAQRDEASGGIRLHDLQLDYVLGMWPDKSALELIRGATRLSAHVIEKDAWQFASQMVGRLVGVDEARQFRERLAAGAPRPWIRALWPALHPPGTSLVRTLEGHSGGVNSVAVSPDGRRAVSASDDNTLKVWDLETGRELRTLQGHSSSVDGVAVTWDGCRAVSASRDKTLKVWDLETGRELRTLRSHSNRVRGVAVSPDGQRAVSASDDKTLKVWDLKTGLAMHTLQGHSFRVTGLAVTSDGRRAVSSSYDNTLRDWDLETGRELRTFEGHSQGVNGVAVGHDRRRAVSASYDNTLRVWDLETGRELRTLRGHSQSVHGVAVTSDGRRAISASSDNTLRVWDLEAGRELRTLKGHSSSVNGVAVSSDGRAVSASRDKTLKVWNLETGRQPRTLEGHSRGVYDVAVSADGRRAVSASRDKTLKLWDLETGRGLGTLQGHSGYVYGVAVTSDGRRAVSASRDKTLKLWDLETGRELRAFQGHSHFVNGVAVTSDGRRAVSGSWDKTLKLWDLETGRELRTLEGHSGSVFGVAVSPDGQRAVSASQDKTLKLWDLETGRELRTLEGHTSSVYRVAVTSDGRRAVSASWDNALKVWDLETGSELRRLEGHYGGVWGVGMTSDGRRAVSASWDKTLKLWDLDTGALLATFTADAALLCCAFSTSETILAGDLGGHLHYLRIEK